MQDKINKLQTLFSQREAINKEIETLLSENGYQEVDSKEVIVKKYNKISKPVKQSGTKLNFDINEMKVKVEKLRKQGLSETKIKDKLGLSTSTFYKYFRNADKKEKLFKKNPAKPLDKEALKKKADMMKAQGMTYVDIAERLNVSRFIIGNFYRDEAKPKKSKWSKLKQERHYEDAPKSSLANDYICEECEEQFTSVLDKLDITCPICRSNRIINA